MRPALLIIVALCLGARVTWAQGNPLGPEFRVNTYTTDRQWFPAVASDAFGNFVVVWQSDIIGDPSSADIFGQRHASSGAPLGPEFRVNTFSFGGQDSPAVASDALGNFVVVWDSLGQDGSHLGVFGQRYGATGTPLGPEFRVNTYTIDAQYNPTVAADSNGNFVVTWTSRQDGSISGIFAQRYASSGTPLGPEFPVNSYTTSFQKNPAVASDPSGNFVVAWMSFFQDGSYWGVFGQRYASTGAPLGPEFRVNTFTTSYQYSHSVAADASGNFVVVWDSTPQDGSAVGIFGQRYASSGAPLGPEFRVNAFTANNQQFPSVAADPAGNFVVVWMSDTQDGSGAGIFGQRYASSGAPLGPEFLVNTHTTSNQRQPSLAADSSGNFVVVWDSNLQDGSNYGVFGQRYNAILPVELMHFRVE